MFKNLIILLSLTFFSGYSYSSCYGKGIQFAPSINVDLSDKLSANTPEWEAQYSTQYIGTFNCNKKKNKFSYTLKLSPKSSHAAVFGFNNGTHWIRAQIVNQVDDRTLKERGEHYAAELNTPMRIRYTLEEKPKDGRVLPGNTLFLDDALMVTDVTGIGLLELPFWLIEQLVKTLQWLLTGNWPYDERDMYGQPMFITYAPKMTTCNFDNAGLTVSLPRIGVSELVNKNQPGFTPFTLNLSCQNMQKEGVSDRAIDIFLSSNTLHEGDPSVLKDNSPQSAQGVGIRLIKRDTPSTPVFISDSNVVKGNATSLFTVGAGGRLESHFSIIMGAYYYAWSNNSLTQGEIKTAATLNIIYP